jgi:hypothetical protein
MTVDDEISAVEQRIARERNALAVLAEDWTGTARDALVSKRSLFAFAALGFVLGDALRPNKPAGAARKLGVGGMLAGVAFSALRARYGSPWALAELAWRGWRSARRTPAPTAPEPVSFPTGAARPPQ